MNAVGIDVSKGKSTVAVLRPFGEIVASPFDVSHSPKELSELVTLLKTLDGDTKVVMEYTGNYYLPIALFLRNNGLFVSVDNPILVKDYSTKSLTVRKVKTDKKDSLKLASFALDRWKELSPFSAQSEARLLLKSYNRQYNQYNKLKVMLKNNLIAILDQTFPGANTLFSTPTRKADGHEKWVDFVLKYPHAECISKNHFPLSLKAISLGVANLATTSPNASQEPFMISLATARRLYLLRKVQPCLFQTLSLNSTALTKRLPH